MVEANSQHQPVQIEGHERQKRLKKKVLSIEDTPEWLARLVINGMMDARHNHLNCIVAPQSFEKGLL
jgi:hypothetical protein